MFDPAKYKARIVDCSIVHDGETLDFKVRQASGRELFRMGAKSRKDATPEQNALELFANFLVNDDGTPITAETAEGIVDMGWPVMKKVSAEIQDKLGLNELAEKKG